MPAVEESVQLLISMMKHTNSGKHDWQSIAGNMGIDKANSAQKRFERLRKDPSTQENGELKYLLAVVETAQNGKPDFHKLAEICGIEKVNTAAKRYERLRKKFGIGSVSSKVGAAPRSPKKEKAGHKARSFKKTVSESPSSATTTPEPQTPTKDAARELTPPLTPDQKNEKPAPVTPTKRKRGGGDSDDEEVDYDKIDEGKNNALVSPDFTPRRTPRKRVMLRMGTYKEESSSDEDEFPAAEEEEAEETEAGSEVDEEEVETEIEGEGENDDQNEGEDEIVVKAPEDVDKTAADEEA